MSQLIKPGTYKAKIIDYGFTQPKEGKNPQAMVMFEFMATLWDEQTNATSESIKKLGWYGSFNGGAKEITIKTLVETFEFKGRTGVELLQGIGSNQINESREYELEIETNEWDGKKNSKIKYVNIPGQTRTVEKLAEADAVKFCGELGLAGAFAEAKQAAPSASEMKNHAPGAEPSFDSNEKIPF